MRRFILATNTALAALSLIALIISYYKTNRFDEVAAGVLVFNIAIFNLPAFIIAHSGRWLTLGIVLTAISLLLLLSLIVGSQISN